MVEVFKTNVTDPDEARLVIEEIHRTFQGCRANFDLDDCDRILRVESCGVFVDPCTLLNLLNSCGFSAQILSDDLPEIIAP